MGLRRRGLIAIAVVAWLGAGSGRGQSPGGVVGGAAAADPAAVSPAPAAVPAIPAVPGIQDVPGLKRRDDVATISTSARLVVLDVVVTDAQGHSVKGLKESDFVLKEDGAVQAIASFTEHERASADAAAAELAKLKLPPNTFSNYGPKKSGASIVFLIDALDTQVQDQMRLRQQMNDFLKSVVPGTPIAIFQLDTTMHMIQGFTSDPAELLAAVESKRDQPGFSPYLPPAEPGDGIGGRLKGDRGSGQMQQFQKEQRSRILTTGMRALGKYLSTFPGRKSLVWFTADVPVALYGPGIDSPLTDQTSFMDDMATTTSVLTLNQVAVYPVDTRGLSTHFTVNNAVQHGALDQVAEETGGRAFYNTNGLKEAMDAVEDTSTNYYTFSYSPTNKQFDGRYRTLQVELARKGVTLAYRQGYYSRNDDAELAQHKALRKSAATGGQAALTVPAVGPMPVNLLDKAMPLGSPEKRDVLFFAQVNAAAATVKASTAAPLAKDNFLAKSYRGGAFRMYEVHFAVRGTSVELASMPNGDFHGRLDFVTVVYDDGGMPVNSQIVKTSIDADWHTYPKILKDGVEMVQTIAVPAKGNFFLRLGVHDETSDKLGTVEVPVGEVKLWLVAKKLP